MNFSGNEAENDVMALDFVASNILLYESMFPVWFLIRDSIVFLIGTMLAQSLYILFFFFTVFIS